MSTPLRECPFNDYNGHRRFLRGNMARGKDNFLAFEGPEGVGKSTGATGLARDLNPKFSLRYDIIRSNEDFMDRIRKEAMEDLDLRKQGIDPKTHPSVALRVRMADEGTDIFLNRDWATVEAKEQLKLGRKTRILRGSWIVNTPDIENLDPWIRGSRLRQRVLYMPVYDEDGMSVGPAQFLWLQEWFDYNEQRRVRRWQSVYDYEAPGLDNDPDWFGYEQDKVQDILDHVDRATRRMNTPQQLRRRGLPVPPKPRGKRKAESSQETSPTTT
jgi:hypothetical protein